MKKISKLCTIGYTWRYADGTYRLVTPAGIKVFDKEDAREYEAECEAVREYIERYELKQMGNASQRKKK